MPEAVPFVATAAAARPRISIHIDDRAVPASVSPKIAGLDVSGFMYRLYSDA